MRNRNYALVYRQNSLNEGEMDWFVDRKTLRGLVYIFLSENVEADERHGGGYMA